MTIEGHWISNDEHIKLIVSPPNGEDYPFTIKMPAVEDMVEGVIKGGKLANLKYNVNGKEVFSYLFFSPQDGDHLMIRATGKSSGRFQGNIPETTLVKTEFI